MGHFVMKKVLHILPFVLPLILFAADGQAAGGHGGHKSKYAGQETRTIKSLSEDDIAELRRGGGWGLAKAAELNGVPGPAHLLEMKAAVPLSADQVTKIEALYQDMKAKAIKQGEELIALELKLERHFTERTITDDILQASLSDIAAARKNLRYMHLATHLKTPGILSEAQINKYNTLRGYGKSDPCANVPEGHNAEMWKRHTGCK
jgi:hypothetical protein